VTPELVGQERTRTETATLRTLVQYAGASGDFYEMHYDLEFARVLGHEELSVHGLLKAAWLGRLVEEWFAGHGRLAVLNLRYRGMDFREQSVTCGGRVTDADEERASLEVWTANEAGTRTTIGTAEVELTGGSG
jgi:acyl dehydratase